MTPLETSDAASAVDRVDRSDQSPISSFRRLGFLLINVGLLFHLFAIIIGPLVFKPTSPLIRSAFDFVAPYLQILYLDHGFDFFSPEPGASTLVAYTLEFPDGSTSTGRMPDKSIGPRLYYHRHFMLTEYLGNERDELQPYIERAFARNLCRQTGAVRVTLTRITHDTPTYEDVQGGTQLNDPSLLTETPLRSYTIDELRQPFVRKQSADESEPAKNRASDFSEDPP